MSKVNRDGILLFRSLSLRVMGYEGLRRNSYPVALSSFEHFTSIGFDSVKVAQSIEVSCPMILNPTTRS